MCSNSLKSANLEKTLNEISKLRNQLLKGNILRQSKSRSASSEELNNQKNEDQSIMTELASSSYQWAPDSGVESQKSDTTVISNEKPVAASERPVSSNSSSSSHVRASSIPRPMIVSGGGGGGSRTSLLGFKRSASLKMDEFTYSNCSREQLIDLINQLNNENSIIKRQFESKNAREN
jgi:hypothetical protein